MKSRLLTLSIVLLGIGCAIPLPAQSYRTTPAITAERLDIATGSRRNVEAWQAYTAFFTIQGSAGGEAWPNNGAVPVIAYGWRGERPQPIRIATDSGFAPFHNSGSVTTLTIQKRGDIFSPLLQRLFEQSETIPSATFTINGPGKPPVIYTLYQVRVASIRDVGSVIGENPATEEIVLVFSQMALAGQ